MKIYSPNIPPVECRYDCKLCLCEAYCRFGVALLNIALNLAKREWSHVQISSLCIFVSSQAIAGGCQNGAVYKAETQDGTYTLVHNFPGLFDAHITMDVDGELDFSQEELTASNGEEFMIFGHLAQTLASNYKYDDKFSVSALWTEATFGKPAGEIIIPNVFQFHSCR